MLTVFKKLLSIRFSAQLGTATGTPDLSGSIRHIAALCRINPAFRPRICFRRAASSCALFILSAPFLPAAQTADDYFHRGAQYYIGGEKEKSKNEIFTGLRLFPDDTQLNGMAVLLKKEEKEQQQNQQQNSQKDQQQQQKDQQQQQKQQQQQQSQSQQKPESSPSQQTNPQDQQQQQQRQAQEAKNKKDEDKQQQAAQSSGQQKQPDQKEQQDTAAAAAGQMTQEQAEQLLDAQKGQEKMLSLQQQGKPPDRNRKFKDW
jgi:outer membrane biosynthesis protein TonB